MKVNLIFVFVGILFIGYACSPAKQKDTGVWANKDCELVHTHQYMLYFERSANRISASLLQVDTNQSKSYRLLAKAVYSDSVISERYIGLKDDSLISTDIVGEVKRDGQWVTRLNGKKQTLNRIESFDIVPSYEMLQADSDNIGKCVQQWWLGTRAAMYPKYNVIAFELGTNRHSYAFVLQDGFNYCRAARIRSDNHGTCFAQNIRLMSKKGEYTCKMSENNKQLSEKKLTIDDSKFDFEHCVFDKGKIYWSLGSFSNDTILLHGCGGETYTVLRESPTSHKISEWLKYVDYDKVHF